jgi:DNA-directed RNA polymerase subunit RPC12/RpoP
MNKYMFKCSNCKTIMIIETSLTDREIHKAPLCPCGYSRMINMASDEYAYGNL